MNLTDYLEWQYMQICGIPSDLNPTQLEKTVFINDLHDIERQKVELANAFYIGDSDKLLNLFFTNATIEFNTEPYYWKNKRSYFWSRASKEQDIKRSTCGFARDIIDTIVSLCCTYKVKHVDTNENKLSDEKLNADVVTQYPFDPLETLNDILEENDFSFLYKDMQLPFYLVEGKGGYKITWNRALYGPNPVINYYTANNVRIHKRGNRVLGMTFLDYFKSPTTAEEYLVAETRAKDYGKDTYTFVTNVFKVSGESNLSLVTESDKINGLPILNSTELRVTGMPFMFAVPCINQCDSQYGFVGRGLLEAKMDLLDDLDKAWSQASNLVTVMTPVEVFNLEYAERDEQNRPKLPDMFFRKYVAIQGTSGFDANGNSIPPVQMTQPQVTLQPLLEYIESIKRQIVGGILSPATMGLDIYRKDSGDAQREKEKLTVFTTNNIKKSNKRWLESLFNQALAAKEYLLENNGTVHVDYGIRVEFDEFSNDSSETKLNTMSSAMANGAISPTMFVDKVYGDSISEEQKKAEIEWLTEKNENKKEEEPPEEPVNPIDEMGEGGPDLGAVQNDVQSDE